MSFGKDCVEAFVLEKACCDTLFPFLSQSVVSPLNFITLDFLSVKWDVHINTALSFMGPSSSTERSLCLELSRGKNSPQVNKSGLY